jgi:hypothetical protein
MRLAAISQYFSSISMPIHFLLRRSQATAVGPDPKNGSITELQSTKRKHQNINATGFS